VAGRQGPHRARQVDVEHLGEHVRVVLVVAADDPRAADDGVEAIEARHHVAHA
jgi:hypothetical protein